MHFYKGVQVNSGYTTAAVCDLYVKFKKKMPVVCAAWYFGLVELYIFAIGHTHQHARAHTHTHTNTHTNTRTNRHANTRTNTRTHTHTRTHTLSALSRLARIHFAIHCNTLQHTATPCNTLQHTATCCNMLQHPATHLYRLVRIHFACVGVGVRVCVCMCVCVCVCVCAK